MPPWAEKSLPGAAPALPGEPSPSHLPAPVASLPAGFLNSLLLLLCVGLQVLAVAQFLINRVYYAVALELAFMGNFCSSAERRISLLGSPARG